MGVGPGAFPNADHGGKSLRAHAFQTTVHPENRTVTVQITVGGIPAA